MALCTRRGTISGGKSDLSEGCGGTHFRPRGAVLLPALLLAVSCGLEAAPGWGIPTEQPPLPAWRPRCPAPSWCKAPGWRAGRLALRGGQRDPGAAWDQAKALDADFQDPDSEASAHADLADYQEPETSDDDLVDPDVPCEELVAREMERQQKEAGILESPGEGGEGGAGGSPREEDGEGGEGKAGEGVADSGRVGEGAADSAEELKSEPDWDEETREVAARLRDMKVPEANETISLESLTLDHSIQKHAMTSRRPDDSARPERGHEVFFHFRGFYGDVPFENSRTRSGAGSKPLSLKLSTDKRSGPGGDFPYMDAWEIVLRSLARGEVALFLVKGEKRVQEMLRRDVSQAPDWVPLDGRGTLRFEVELINFGFKEVVAGGGVMYKCVWDGYGDESPLAHDEVWASVAVRRGGEQLCSTKGVRSVQLGVGLLPRGVETALVREFRKGSAGVVQVKGEHAQPAPPGSAPRPVQGLAGALLNGANTWAGLCGGSFGSVEPVVDWAAVGEGGGEEYEIELKDWNEVHNMSALVTSVPGADRYASHGDVIVKNLGHREDRGIDGVHDGDTIMLLYKLRGNDTAKPPKDGLLEAEAEKEEGVWWDTDLQRGANGREGGKELEEGGIREEEEGREGDGDESSEELNQVERLMDIDSEEERPRGKKRRHGGVLLEKDDAPEPAFQVTVGNGDLPPGLDLGLTRTFAGCASVITVLEGGRQDVYDVFVEAIVQRKYELQWGEKLRLAEMRKAQGNELFGKNETLKALSKYRFSAQLVIPAQSIDYVPDEKDKESERVAMQVRTACQMNSAVCLMKVLRRDGKNVKALYWKAKALRGLGMLDQAKLDLQRLLELKPNDAEASFELKEVRRIQRAEDAKAAPVFRRMFGDPKGKKPGSKKVAAKAPSREAAFALPEDGDKGGGKMAPTSQGTQQDAAPAGEHSRRAPRPPEMEGPSFPPDVITPGTKALDDYARTNNTEYLTDFLAEHEDGNFLDKVDETFGDLAKKACGVPLDKDGPEDMSE